MASSLASIKLRLALSVAGLLSGLALFIVMGAKYYNWNASIWGLVSGIAAGITIILHVLYTKNVWQLHSRGLKYMIVLGCYFQLAGIIGFVTYLTLGLKENQGIVIYGSGYYIACVCCCLTWKWGFVLFYCARYYRRQLCNVYTILPTEPSSYTD